MFLPVTVVTVAYGSSDVVKKWAVKWSEAGATCVIADNGNLISPDVSSYAKVLPFSGNSGFGAGINRAVQEADTPVVLITNPDTLPGNADSLEILYNSHSHGNLTTGATFNSQQSLIHSTGIWPSRDWIRTQICRPAKSLWRRDRMDWLQGSLIMADRDSFLDLGGFSNNFPLYFEDVDLCFRAKKRGMAINYCSESSFIHDEGSGSERASATRLSCFHWGLLEFFRNHDPENLNSVRRMLIAKCIVRIFSYSLWDFQAVKGYSLALRSLFTGIPPELPGSVNG